MKKVLSLALALILMIGALSVTSFAANQSSDSQDVIINIGSGATHTYSADITFAPGSFIFETDSKWDSTIHNYVPGETGEWNNTMGSVSVTNHSDLPVDYTVTISGIVNTYGTLDIVFEGEDAATKTVNGTIAAVAIGAASGVEKELAKWDVTGTPAISEIDAKKLGTITVTVTMQNP